MNDDKAKYLWQPIAAILAGLFFIFFLWGLWTKGTYALGLNATIFCLGFLFFVGKASEAKTIFSRNNLSWAIPIAIMSISFVLFENPFFKIIHCLSFPFIATLVYALHRLQNPKQDFWTQDLLRIALFKSIANFFTSIPKATEGLLSFSNTAIPFRNPFAASIYKGLIILILLLCAIIPLLLSADSLFAQHSERLITILCDYISLTTVAKIIVGLIVAVSVFSSFIAWASPISYDFSNAQTKRDSIVAGIIIAGLLLVYFFFLGVQIERLWIDTLPFEFRDTEEYVKSGFWQLVILSFLNVVLFISYYKRTSNLSQALLSIFSIASLLLVVSAAHRMALYVAYYGFSYEKFYATYTVLFCAILICVLTYVSFQQKPKDVVRIGFTLLLWMYTAVSVFPTERFILQSTLALSRLPESRMDIGELRMLSTDVLPLVTRYLKLGEIVEDLTGRDNCYSYEKRCWQTDDQWAQWLAARDLNSLAKPWYELTLSDLNYRLIRFLSMPANK